MDKVDVVIPTRDPKTIRPQLLRTLERAPWVNILILETSKPLANARINGASKAKTEWIAMFDDDVEIPDNWFDLMSPHAGDGVLCVSGVFVEQFKPMAHYQRVVGKFYDLNTLKVPRICNVLIRREVLVNYPPPSLKYSPDACFYCEDEILYRYVQKQGQWLAIPNTGVKHYFKPKDPSRSGRAFYDAHFWTWRNIAFRLVTHFVFSWVACWYSRDLSPVRFWYSHYYKFCKGWLSAWKENKKVG